jgi:hypothetical protein
VHVVEIVEMDDVLDATEKKIENIYERMKTSE